MKKLFLAITLAVCAFYVNAFDFINKDWSVWVGLGEYLVAYGDKIYKIEWLEDKPTIEYEVNKADNIRSQNGYLSVTGGNETYYLLDYNGYIIPSRSGKNDPYKNDQYFSGYNEPKTVKATSELRESIHGVDITYKSTYPFYRLCRDKECGSEFLFNGFPWVPNIATDKEQYIDVYFEEATKYLAIIGGFVDFTRQYLFKENARIKTIEITDIRTNNKIGRYVLKDSVEFSIVKLPYAFSDIRIRIVDTYPGSKYADPCISCINADEYACKNKGDYGIAMIKDLEKEGIFN